MITFGGFVDVSKIGDFIKTRRQALELSQKDVASTLTKYGSPYKHNAISSWETGVNDPPLTDPVFASHLAIALETTTTELYQAAGVFDQSVNLRRQAFVNMVGELTEDELEKSENFIKFLISERRDRKKN